MNDSGREPGPRCLWCGQPLGDGPSRRRYCARPRLCRDQAYRDRRRAKQAQPARGALARAGHSLDVHLQNVREVLLQAVLQGDAWPGVFALAAAGVESRAADLVRVRPGGACCRHFVGADRRAVRHQCGRGPQALGPVGTRPGL
ncbi:hypothetical protein PV721_23195 [Streptomyces sp. MB09-01]|uniref:hypothetical protein n=1 Tax=Streptomyces sp. MB09-01 TaxID=3028666 RepID=UPI0029AB85F6|nr:hypothetical protein [Streptomyces sp. MB09-01]MDX3537226.1 hypothetical protein [Streptomyces sp. MB09-01]